LLYQIYFLILLNPYLIVPILIFFLGLLFYIFIERKRELQISILWGNFTILFGIIFLFLLSQLEVQTFREDLGIWKRIASIIILTGSIYSVILIISKIKSLERK